MSDVESFFDFLDRYLIGDLEVMVNKVPAGKTGGLGYPTMQAILSGALFGDLLDTFVNLDVRMAVS